MSTAYRKWNLLNVVHSFAIILNMIFRKLVRKVNEPTSNILNAVTDYTQHE